MFNKCQYLDEITGGKGITFATGTPISNSMTELYVMQRYLQNSKLQNMGLGLFDSWASTFGEVVTSIEFAPLLEVQNNSSPYRNAQKRQSHKKL